MRYELNIQPEPFETFSEFDEESETLDAELADWEWEEEAGRRRRPRPAVSRAKPRSRIISTKRRIKSPFRPPIRSPRPPVRPPRLFPTFPLPAVSVAEPRPPKPPAPAGAEPKGAAPAPAAEPATLPSAEPSAEGSEHVRWVQDSLNRILGLRLPVDGIMGPEVRSAVRSFQEQQGLPITGLVGPDTERALIAARSGQSPGPAATKPDEPGMTEPPEPAATPPDPDSAKPAGEFGMEDMELWEMPLEFESGHCTHCGLPREEFDFEFEADGNLKLTDIVINPPSSPGNYGRASSFKNPTTTSERCKGGVAKTCPTLPSLEDVSQVSGIGFEYIAGWTDKHKKKHPGIIFSKSTGKRIVVEKNRLKNRVHKMLPRAAGALATFIANMRAINMPVEAILTMGSIYCRCISGTTKLSNHSYGDAIDIGGLRFVGGREVLVANSGDVADRQLLHRANACLRLSFATVIDYHDRKRHWDHFHCDTNIQNGGERRLGVAWPFVRESLGLSPKGGWDKKTNEPANSLKKFAGAGAVKDKATLDRTLSRLFMREAARV